MNPSIYVPAETGGFGYFDPCGEQGRNELTEMIIRYMLIRLDSMFAVDGLPDDVPERYVKQILLTCGFGVWGKPNGVEVMTWAGLGGSRTAYYQPDLLIITNPYIPWNDQIPVENDRGVILIENDPYRTGVLSILRRYASAMADTWITMRMININARCPAMVSSDDRKTLDSANQFFKDLAVGKMGIVTKKDFESDLTSTPYADAGKQTIRDVVELNQYLDAALWRELGVQAAWNAKREALHSDEVNMDAGILLPLVDTMMISWQRGFDQVNRIYNHAIRVRKASAWDETEQEVMSNDDIASDVPAMDGGDAVGDRQQDPDEKHGSDVAD